MAGGQQRGMVNKDLCQGPTLKSFDEKLHLFQGSSLKIPYYSKYWTWPAMTDQEEPMTSKIIIWGLTK